MLTLFESATGLLCAKGVTHTPNTVLHPWLVTELEQLLAKRIKPPPPLEAHINHAAWSDLPAKLLI